MSTFVNKVYGSAGSHNHNHNHGQEDVEKDSRSILLLKDPVTRAEILEKRRERKLLKKHQLRDKRLKRWAEARAKYREQRRIMATERAADATTQMQMAMATIASSAAASEVEIENNGGVSKRTRFSIAKNMARSFSQVHKNKKKQNKSSGAVEEGDQQQSPGQNQIKYREKKADADSADESGVNADESGNSPEKVRIGKPLAKRMKKAFKKAGNKVLGGMSILETSYNVAKEESKMKQAENADDIKKNIAQDKSSNESGSSTLDLDISKLTRKQKKKLRRKLAIAKKKTKAAKSHVPVKASDSPQQKSKKVMAKNGVEKEKLKEVEKSPAAESEELKMEESENESPADEIMGETKLVEKSKTSAPKRKKKQTNMEKTVGKKRKVQSAKKLRKSSSEDEEEEKDHVEKDVDSEDEDE